MARDDTMFEHLRQALEDGRPAAQVTVVRGESVGAKLLVLPAVDEFDVAPDLIGSLGDEALNKEATRLAFAQLEFERSATVTLDGTSDTVSLFVEVYPLPQTLVIVGAVHVGQALCQLAKLLHYRVVVCDARGALATTERFPDADQVIRAWPDDALGQLRINRSTAIAILTHDPKFDEPAIVSALATPARYIGAIGSRRTNEDRRDRLAESGITADQVARIRGPIGLNIGAESPEEMAVAIMAEIIAVRHGRPGGALARASGKIRGDEPGVEAKTATT